MNISYQYSKGGTSHPRDRDGMHLGVQWKSNMCIGHNKMPPLACTSMHCDVELVPDDSRWGISLRTIEFPHPKPDVWIANCHFMFIDKVMWTWIRYLTVDEGLLSEKKSRRKERRSITANPASHYPSILDRNVEASMEEHTCINVRMTDWARSF